MKIRFDLYKIDAFSGTYLIIYVFFESFNAQFDDNVIISKDIGSEGSNICGDPTINEEKYSLETIFRFTGKNGKLYFYYVNTNPINNPLGKFFYHNPLAFSGIRNFELLYSPR